MDHRLQKLAQLPSLPTVAIRLLNMFADPEVGITSVVQVLQTDPALSGKILKAANTSRFGLTRPVSDLQRAVMLLGKKSVMALALGFSLSEASMKSGPHCHLYSDFWFQSLVRGCAASLLADQYSKVDASEAFTVGLLARIGRLALLHCDSERFVGCLQEAESTSVPLDTIESRSSDITSMDISLHLFREWKLPDHCVKAVESLKLSVEEVCQRHTPDEVTLADIIQIATAFGEFFSGEQRGLAIVKIYELGSALLGEPESVMNELVDKIRQELDNHSDLFSVDMSKVGSPLELLSQAMSQLSMLAVNASVGREEGPQASHEMLEENGRLRKRVLELTQTSQTDPLTSVFNRACMGQHLQERCDVAREKQHPLAVLFIDLDHFKSINDTYGHAMGDEVLRAVAGVLKSTTRDTDVVTRYGGEEFVIVTAAPDVPGLSRQADRLRQRIEALKITSGEITLQVTASIGGAIGIPPRDAHDFGQELLEVADAAMYASKKNGRNRVTIAPECLRVSTTERVLQPG
jgi:diguanylate cyclase (GGDEF)-like protein